MHGFVEHFGKAEYPTFGTLHKNARLLGRKGKWWPKVEPRKRNYILNYVEYRDFWTEIQRKDALPMVDMKRHLIRHSVRDVIHTLENVPVRGDMILEIPIIQTINRVSLAHLSVERAMKFLIIDAGQTYTENHHLPLHLKN